MDRIVRERYQISMQRSSRAHYVLSFVPKHDNSHIMLDLHHETRPPSKTVCIPLVIPIFPLNVAVPLLFGIFDSMVILQWEIYYSHRHRLVSYLMKEIYEQFEMNSFFHVARNFFDVHHIVFSCCHRNGMSWVAQIESRRRHRHHRLHETKGIKSRERWIEIIACLRADKCRWQC